MNPRSHKMILYMSGGILAASLAAWGFAAYKSYSDRAAIAEISGRLALALEDDAYLSSARNALRDSRDDVALLRSRFVEKDGVSSFIDGIEARASEFGLKADLGSISFDDSASGPRIRPLGIRISGFGEWRSVARYVSALDSLPYAGEIKSLSLSKREAAQGEAAKAPLWNFSIDLVESVLMP